ncbi:MAG: isochorismate synthase MenF [Haloferacaceae archaeon]
MSAPRGDEVPAGLVSRAVEIPSPPPRAVLRDARRPRTVWDPSEGPSVVAGGAAATLETDGPARFDAVREGAESLLAAGDVHAGTEAACPRLFGGFAFHEQGSEGAPWSAFPAARFVLPRVQVTYADRGTWLTVTAAGADADPTTVEARVERERERLASLPDPGPTGDPPGIRERVRTTTRADWRRGVEAAVERIRAGDLRKVVLAQGLEARLQREPSLPDVLSRLGETYPDCYRFLVEPVDDSADGDGRAGGDPSASDDGGVGAGTDGADGGATDRTGPVPGFFGATPERLVRLHGRTVSTGALAGTTGRGDTPAEDEWLARELMNDAKNVHEHELVAEAVRDQLAPFAAGVRSGERRVRRLATVQHLFTPISATLDEDAHVLDLVEALHPTPAVGGLPPERALATIRDSEPFDRGWYAAPVGWFDAAGNGEFAVTIRSAVAEADAVTMFAGVGIVADSDPDREWDEVQLKYRPILDALER